MAKKDPHFGYVFSRKDLETLALTHSSCRSETGDNQRLEFLGDAALGLIIATKLYQRHPDCDEGALDRARAAIINGRELAAIATEIGLDEMIQLGESQRQHQPEPTRAMLEDCLEAWIGAIYLDGGLPAAERFVLSAFQSRLEKVKVGSDNRSPKSRLQEWAQAKHQGSLPDYELIEAEGPDHNRRYHAKVSLVNEELGRGQGSSIKAAESAAAAAALLKIDSDA